MSRAEPHSAAVRNLAIRNAAIWLGLPQTTISTEFKVAQRDGIDCVRLWASRPPSNGLLQWHAMKSPEFLRKLTV